MCPNNEALNKRASPRNAHALYLENPCIEYRTESAGQYDSIVYGVKSEICYADFAKDSFKVLPQSEIRTKAKRTKKVVRRIYKNLLHRNTTIKSNSIHINESDRIEQDDRLH